MKVNEYAATRDEFGDRLKSYEIIETQRKLRNDLPVYVRIDGRGFSRFTKGMEKPFDKRMSDMMIATTKYLVKNTHAKVGYTQSDEISLLYNGPMIFDGKLLKICSVLSGMTSSFFMKECLILIPEYADKNPHFDCRAFNVPSISEAVNTILWRVKDCEKNAVSMAAHYELGHKKVMGKSTLQRKGMLKNICEIDFDSHYPAAFRNGTFIKSETITRNLTEEVLLQIPENKRPNPETQFERSQIKTISFDNDLNFHTLRDFIFSNNEFL